ncbi:MAG: pyridoxal-phosphate dependent enzyme, partial [Chloroflexota bacterium]
MSSSSYLTVVSCLTCHQKMAYRADLDGCKHCGSAWLDAEYDYETVATHWRTGIQSTDRSLWRYRLLLPPIPDEFVASIGEGGTPLFRAKKLEQSLGHGHIYIKDERQTPTNSFKDRQGSVAISILKQRDVKECVLASTGNAAVAYAAYTACADIKLWVFLNSQVPAEKMREVGLYGAEVIKVTGTYDESKKVAADFAKRRDIHLDKGAKAIGGKESMKTLAFEIAEQLPLAEGNSNVLWQAPDWYIQAVSGGIGPLGVLKGFEELYKMGLIDRIPKIGVVQTDGCAPMVEAMAANQEQATPVIPSSRIIVLSTGDPGLAYEILRQAQLKNGGSMVSVSDEDAFAAMRHLAQTQGISVEPATSVAFAGLKKMAEAGHINKDEVVVVNCSGHTFPAEKHIMDDQIFVDMELSNQAKSHEEGLQAALDLLDEQITSVAVIDDNELDRLLVKRVLEKSKPYRVFEASGGAEGIDLVKTRRPDLVILDLNMPEVDGFMVLDALKHDKTTKDIPVVVVSAKELSSEEREMINDNAASHWQKGSFSAGALLNEMIETIKMPKKPTDKGRSIIDAFPHIDKSTQKVAIIDDNPEDARLLRRILESQRPFQIVEASSGKEGLSLVREEMPDLVLLDLTLPDLSGFEVLEMIKSDPALKRIPVIIVSGKELSVEQQAQLDRDQLALLKKGEITTEALVS